MFEKEPIGVVKLQQIFVAVITIILVGAVLKSAHTVILPLIMAWLLSFLLAPPIQLLTRWKVPNLLAIVVVLLLLLGILYLAGMYAMQRVQAFMQAYPKYQAQWVVILNEIFDNHDQIKNAIAVIDISKYIQQYLVAFSGLAVKFVSNLVLVIIFLFFMLLGKKYSGYKVGHMFTLNRAKQFLHISYTISHGIRRYLGLQFVISAVTGVCVAVGLTIIGVDFAITWGVLAFVLNFIPNIGSIVASIPPVLIAFIQYYPSFWPAIATALTLLAIQQAIGNFIAPKVLGDSLDLSPVVILLALLFFGWMWGIVGAILSVPIAVAIKITCDNIDGLEFLGVMMSSGQKYRKEFLEKSCSNLDEKVKDDLCE